MDFPWFLRLSYWYRLELPYLFSNFHVPVYLCLQEPVSGCLLDLCSDLEL